MSDDILDILTRLGINYQITRHEAVFTVEQAEKFWKNIKGVHCKNLFLRDAKGKQHYLVILEKSKRLAIKELEQKLGDERLSFASEARLYRYLKLNQGAVSPFGIINDAENHVKLLIDSDLKQAETVNFHPNVNTATVSLAFADFEKFLDWSGNPYSYINS